MKKLGAISETPFMPVTLRRSISARRRVVTVTGWRSSERACLMEVTLTSPMARVSGPSFRRSLEESEAVACSVRLIIVNEAYIMPLRKNRSIGNVVD